MRILLQDASSRWLLTLSLLSSACAPAPVVEMDAAAEAATAQDTGTSQDSAAQSDVADASLALDAVTVDDVSSDQPIPPSDSSRDSSASDVVASMYPAGPYGAAQGDTLENLSLVGYVNPEGTALSTTLPFAPTDLQALRATGRRYALVHTSAFY
ncbi:MAG: hypothetical protein Q8Q09_16740 [Deltaproteobacteria bacterium]|nr:hypothetical protein [Deltaproteobacteria bacterium]